jgi:hypothetical protein
MYVKERRSLEVLLMKTLKIKKGPYHSWHHYIDSVCLPGPILKKSFKGEINML